MLFSSVNMAINDILSEYEALKNAPFSVKIEPVYNEFDLNFKFYEGIIAGQIAVAFNTDFSVNKTRILVKLKKEFFSVLYEKPSSLDEVFTHDINIDDLKLYTSSYNPICYVSSVTYGVLYFILYESDANEEDLLFSLNYEGKGPSVSIEDRLRVVETMQKTNCKILQISGDNLFNNIALDLDAFSDFKEKGASFDANNHGGVISYSVNYLKNDKPVKLNNTMEYEIEECISTTTHFECPQPPELTTNNITNIIETGVELGGYIIFEGSPPYNERGVCYSTSPEPTISNNKIIIQGTISGNFTTYVNDFDCNTTYYVRAYAVNPFFVAYGQEVMFTTPWRLPVIADLGILDITKNSAQFSGQITYEGCPAYTEKGFVYGTMPNPTIENNKKVSPYVGVGVEYWGSLIDDLIPNTTYYARSYAINDAGIIYGNQSIFSTSP